MTAFVLGNGVSRRPIDIDLLLDLGDVYACNAVYRTHAVTALVATDRPIANEIQASGYSLGHRFYTRRPEPKSGALCVPRAYFSYSSGPIAVALACLDHHLRIYLLGFDLGPDEQNRFNNLFAGTDHYKKQNSTPTFTGNWIKQLVKISQDFPKVEFIRIHGPTTAEISILSQAPNISRLEITEFAERINSKKDL